MLDGEAASREDQLETRCERLAKLPPDGVARARRRALAACRSAARAGGVLDQLGGRSAGPFESLNLGLRTGDERAAVLTNRARLAAAIDRDPDGMLLGRQVHEAEVLVRERAPEPNPYVGGQPAPAADGQATPTRG